MNRTYQIKLNQKRQFKDNSMNFRFMTMRSELKNKLSLRFRIKYNNYNILILFMNNFLMTLYLLIIKFKMIHLTKMIKIYSYKR